MNILYQFMYDNHSLNVLMSSGLIPSLVGFLDQVNSELSGKLVCKTGKERMQIIFLLYTGDNNSQDKNLVLKTAFTIRREGQLFPYDSYLFYALYLHMYIVVNPAHLVFH